MATTVWKGHLTFGLVEMPVRLVRAARAERTKLRQLYRPRTTAPPELEEEKSGTATPRREPPVRVGAPEQLAAKTAPPSEAAPQHVAAVRRVFQAGDENVAIAPCRIG